MSSAPEQFRALAEGPNFTLLPAIWDGLSSKLAFGAGFGAAFLSGSCVSAARLGGPDLDLLSFSEMFDSFNMVLGAAPESLVLVDADHGYGNAMNVQRTVRAYGRAGAAAILIEDKRSPRDLTSTGKQCLPRDEAVMKIRAAVEAAKDSGILVLARTDCRPTLGIEEALTRIELFKEAGADILFLDSAADNNEARQTLSAADGVPCFAVLTPKGPEILSCAKLAAEAGFKLGSFPMALLSPVVAGVQAGLSAISSGQSKADIALSPGDLREVLGYPDYDLHAGPFRLP